MILFQNQNQGLKCDLKSKSKIRLSDFDFKSNYIGDFDFDFKSFHE